MRPKCKKNDLCSVWRRCRDWSNVSKVVCGVLAGDFSVDDAPGSGRPVEVDSEIETLIQNSPCYYTMKEIANILKICKSINLLVKMKNVFFYSTEKHYTDFLGNPISSFQATVKVSTCLKCLRSGNFSRCHGRDHPQLLSTGRGC